MTIKRSFLTKFIPVLLIGSMSYAINAAEIYNKSSNKIGLYGKVVGLHHFSDNSVNNGDKTYVLLGFKNETRINDQLIGYGRWEHNFVANNSGFDNSTNLWSSNKTYLAYAGIKTSSHGSFDYGRNYGIIHDATKYTTVLPEFGGDVVYSDNFFAGRVSNVATYRNNDFFGLINGLNFGLQYLGKNEHADKYVVDANSSSSNLSKVIHSNGEGWGTSLSYEFDNFSVVGAYGAADRTNAQEDSQLRGKGIKAEQWVTGLKYDANNVYLAANYGETHNSTPIANGFANETKDVLLVAQYHFDFGLRPSVAYIKSKAKNVEGVGDENLVKYVEVGTTYSFNKNMSTYLDYKINKINNGNKLGLSPDDTVALGIIYKF